MDGIAEVPASQLDAPYAERWGLLKPALVRMYIDEKKKLKEIVEIMKADYKFYASESQYKRQFGIWNITKALPTKKKAKISKVLETRAQQGKSSVVLQNGKEVEHKKMRRYMKEQGRREMAIWLSISNGPVDIENLSGHALQCGNRVFMNWYMPAAVLPFLNSKAINHLSPNTQVGTPMSGIVVATPSSNAGPSPRNPQSPGNALSPKNEPSPMTVAVYDNLKLNRALLFVQKHHTALLGGMNLQEQIVITDWMHQFWQFSFRTARTWGRGPRTWNSTNLKFDRFSGGMIDSLPNTPGLVINSPGPHPHQQNSQPRFHNTSNIQKPSSLCQWSIHVREVSYERNNSPLSAQDIQVDPDDELTWRPWTEHATIHDLANSLEKTLESNDFSNMALEDLPIAAKQIVTATKRSPEQLLEEAFGFSIMGRNCALVREMVDHMGETKGFVLHDLFPLHLASSYLDGAKTCCEIFDALIDGMPTGEASVRKLYINQLDHTVLDNLMIAILKAHTSCTPVMVDESFKKEPRFAGEEVDICGRWDADSDCIRQLQASGNPTIPQSWKHMFCHTSVQAITHCIGNLFSPHWAPDINTPSGLFLKRCLNENCGLKLQLKPLHTLVVTAVYLAQLGSEGENLFGMLACLLCLLGKGANPLLKAHASLVALLGNGDSQGCSHSELDPLELAQRVPEEIVSKWPQKRKTGWKVFCNVLRLSQNEWKPQVPHERTRNLSDGARDIYSMDVNEQNEFNDEDESEDESEDDSEDESEDGGDYEGLPAFCAYHINTTHQENFFRKNRYLATLWATVQTEMLSYRRIAEGDSWISENFNMESLLESLEKEKELSIGFVSKKMMKPFCRCGIFCTSDDVVCQRVEEASAYYFSNLEDWNRTSFLYAPTDRAEFWDRNQ